jgi:hypothetical protein
MSNPFEAYAERSKQPHEKRRERLAQKRKSRQLLKKQIEQSQLERDYKLLEANELEELVSGPHGALFRELVGFLDQLALHNGWDLLPFLRERDWRPLPPELRFRALQLVDRACIRARERARLAPFDDPLPWEDRPLVLDLVREVLGAP